MIVVENLTKIYGKQRAVDNINFVAESGKITGFLGPNGAGKSTTMKIATGYLKATSGTVQVAGFDITTHTKEAQRALGYLPEHNPLYLDMYVREYLGFMGKIYKVARLENRIKEVIEMCGLEREAHKKVGMLSKGYRQRVGLAQALIHNPSVMILDEPTTGLDPNQIIEIRNLIKQIAQEKTILLSTHIMQEVQAICDKVVIIHLGKIVADAPVSEITKLFQTERILKVEFAESIDENIIAKNFEKILQIQHIAGNLWEIRTPADIDLRADLFQLAKMQNWTILEIKQEEKNIENVFRELTRTAI
ncbi:gliding motility-associated ABC transporter ATP-binding subunit GldA [Raineya orbicola]|uniref:Gliding motility-associated ABC transporter ATP-binding subunit GldA n=1 Tax=Raineya orbicola TaxID=2016530 RepID=A0A2N3IHJ0_9BACT|nr:gliding motility-associated ABC transporter ATP-binding subunit GldA [Raineya orbicola]PKQ69764.1 Gliding motility-associated ABC transporter ATP-binding subunit GldA [Raineya orbicola]